MTKLVKEYLDVADHTSLDDAIAMLMALRQALPSGAHAELRMRGDDVFGHRLSICYHRPQTPEEAEVEARYSHVAPVAGDVSSYERVEGEISLAA